MNTPVLRYALRFRILVSSAAALLATSGLAAHRSPQQDNFERRAEAPHLLQQGVEAFKKGEFDRAIDLFTQAKTADPSLVNAKLYLATAYANQYIPGEPGEENKRSAKQAIEEFERVLAQDPSNLSAIDGIGSILYNMAGGPPFDPDKMQASRSYHKKHIAIKPADPEPYYWIGVIDWSLAFRGNNDLREEWLKSSGELERTAPLPEIVREKFSSAYGRTIEEGMEALKKAMTLKPEYVDAMAYLNLLYRQKADMDTPGLREEDFRLADDLVDQVKAIKLREMEMPQPEN
jgi:tetratricopeptide (TPR) repeat protein